MKVFATAAQIEGDPTGTVYRVDTIEFAGGFWLVPEWLENRLEGWRQPARAIPLARLRHQREPNDLGAEFVVNLPRPRVAYDGPIAEAIKIHGVVERPDIHFPLGKGLQ